MLIGLLVFSKPIIKSSIHLSTKMVRKAIVTLAWLLVNCLCFHKKTLFKPGWSQICSWYALHHDLEKPVNSTHSSFWSRERQSPTNLCLGSHWSKMGHNWRHWEILMVLVESLVETSPILLPGLWSTHFNTMSHLELIVHCVWPV